MNEAMRREIEKIYVESWQKGISVPFFDNEGNIYLANPDGSEDRVSLDRKTRTYRVLHRTAQPGKGRYSHLIARWWSAAQSSPSLQAPTVLAKAVCAHST